MSTGAAMPTPVVLGLTAAVLAAHLWLLNRGTPEVRPAAPVRSVPFTIRSIAAPAPTTEPPTASPGFGPRRASPGPARPLARFEPSARATERAPAAAPARAEPAAPASAAPHEPVAGALSTPPVNIPPSVLLRYEVTARARQQPIQGTSELAWRHDGARYEARFEVATSSSPARAQHSAGRVGAGGLEPSRFGDRGRGEQAAHFDRETQHVVFSNNRPAASLAAGAQDRLSVLLQLASLVAGGTQRFPAGATVAIQTATTRDAEEWTFTVEGEERLQLPGGDVVALKLTRPPRGEFDQRLELWLAPGLAYVPVRLRLTQRNGDWTDHQWLATDRP